MNHNQDVYPKHEAKELTDAAATGGEELCCARVFFFFFFLSFWGLFFTL